MAADLDAIRTKWAVPLVEKLDAHSAFGAPWIREAFLKVPRHLFVRRRQVPPDNAFVPINRADPSEDDLKEVYNDYAILTRTDPPSSSSQPTVMAWMLNWLDLKPGMKVLEIGAGTGFNAALLSVGTGDPSLVHAIDIQPEVIEEAREHLRDAGFDGVHLRCGDGGHGWPDAAPFDRIIVTAGTPDIPPAWRDQLTGDGVMVMPFTVPGIGNPGLRLRQENGHLQGSFLGSMHFMDLRGAYGEWSAPLLGPTIRPAWNARLAIRGTPRYHFQWDWTRWNYAHLGGLWFSLRSRDWLFGSFSRDSFMNGKRWTDLHVARRGRLCVAWDYQSLRVFGDPGPAWNFAALIERWKAAGYPTTGNFAVTLLPDGAAMTDPAPPVWIERRPSACLEVTPFTPG